MIKNRFFGRMLIALFSVLGIMAAYGTNKNKYQWFMFALCVIMVSFGINELRIFKKQK
jgi:hypothetical protein